MAAYVVVVADVDNCDGGGSGGVEEDGGEAFTGYPLDGCGVVR